MEICRGRRLRYVAPSQKVMYSDHKIIPPFTEALSLELKNYRSQKSVIGAVKDLFLFLLFRLPSMHMEGGGDTVRCECMTIKIHS